MSVSNAGIKSTLLKRQIVEEMFLSYNASCWKKVILIQEANFFTAFKAAIIPKYLLLLLTMKKVFVK